MKSNVNRPILVLAGGFGSRLRSMVSNVPKPLAPVCGKPFLFYLIENLISLGARDFVFLLHYEAGVISSRVSSFIDKLGMADINITYLVEDTPLGTGGSVLNAVNILNIKKSFMVVNADTWLEIGFEKLVLSCPNTIASIEVKDCTRYGSLIVEGEKITRFMEKKYSSGPGLINAGLYHLNPNIFEEAPKNTSFSLEGSIFPSIIKKDKLNAMQINTNFIDIGIPEDYLRFCRWIKSGKTYDL